MTGLAARRVSPFGHPGITAHVQLPQAYRSLSRPSSPLDAKASTVCLIAFDLKIFLDARERVHSTFGFLTPDLSLLAPGHVNTIHLSIVKERKVKVSEMRS